MVRFIVLMTTMMMLFAAGVADEASCEGISGHGATGNSIIAHSTTLTQKLGLNTEMNQTTSGHDQVQPEALPWNVQKQINDIGTTLSQLVRNGKLLISINDVGMTLSQLDAKQDAVQNWLHQFAQLMDVHKQLDAPANAPKMKQLEQQITKAEGIRGALEESAKKVEPTMTEMQSLKSQTGGQASMVRHAAAAQKAGEERFAQEAAETQPEEFDNSMPGASGSVAFLPSEYTASDGATYRVQGGSFGFIDRDNDGVNDAVVLPVEEETTVAATTNTQPCVKATAGAMAPTSGVFSLMNGSMLHHPVNKGDIAPGPGRFCFSEMRCVHHPAFTPVSSAGIFTADNGMLRDYTVEAGFAPQNAGVFCPAEEVFSCVEIAEGNKVPAEALFTATDGSITNRTMFPGEKAPQSGSICFSKADNAAQQSSLFQAQHDEQADTSGEAAPALYARRYRVNTSDLEKEFDTTLTRKGFAVWLGIQPACPSNTHTNTNGFYVIAHMTNNVRTVNWAIREGANALEIDFNYNNGYAPYEMYHGTVCDCNCMLLWHEYDSVCPTLGAGVMACEASTSIDGFLQTVSTKSTLALVYCDNKVSGGWGAYGNDLAGENFANKLVSQFFTSGSTFKGDVVVGVPNYQSFEFLEKAKAIFEPLSAGLRVFYTIDMDYSVIQKLAGLGFNRAASTTIGVMQGLSTYWIIYSTGATACNPGGFQSQLRAAMNTGAVAFVLHWTIDADSSMDTYIDVGVRGIVTNFPEDLAERAACKSKSLQNAVSNTPDESAFRFMGSYTCQQSQAYWRVCTNEQDINHWYFMIHCKATCAIARGESPW